MQVTHESQIPRALEREATSTRSGASANDEVWDGTLQGHGSPEWTSLSLLQHPLFSARAENLDSNKQRVRLSYERAIQLGRAHGLTPMDSLFLSDKFWNVHKDPFVCLDGAATTLLTIQLNLFCGTVSKFAMTDRPDLMPILQKALNFEVSAQYLLTEVGRGLDVANMQTTVTLLPNGELDLHTPNPSAAKFMPPTSFLEGIPRVGVLFARLVVHGEDRGIRPFMVALSDGKKMCQGVTSQVLPCRGGADPLDHSITTFDHVRLPFAALLGSPDKPKDPRTHFFEQIWRVPVGTIALGLVTIPSIKAAAYIAGTYSLRRCVTTPSGQKQPIIAFRTQQLPILRAIAHAAVLEAFGEWAIELFTDGSLDFRVRHAIAAAVKALGVQHVQQANQDLSERCGAQGLFEHNLFTRSAANMRGVAIAEGDLLGLSIKLVPELLLGRYSLPPSNDPRSWLARHEAGLFGEARAQLASLPGGHRSEAFNRHVLPACQPMLEAIGHRMAYDAAVAAGVDPRLVALYEASVISLDRSWYSSSGLSRSDQRALEDSTVSAALPHLRSYLKAIAPGIAPYARVAPATGETQEGWDTWVDGLEAFEGEDGVAFDLGLSPEAAPFPARAHL